MKKILGIFVALIVGLGVNSALAAVTTVDLYNQFPDAQGQNGFYAYGYQASRSVPYRQLTREGAYYFSTPEQDWHIPYVRKTATPWLTMAPSAVDQTGKEYGAENAVLSWRAPETNIFALSGQFSMQDGGAVIVYIRKNDTILWSAPIDFVGTADFDLPAVSLIVGDMLYFGVDAGAEDYNDTTQLKGAISYTARGRSDAAGVLLLLD